jgi:hypothetical protein
MKSKIFIVAFFMGLFFSYSYAFDKDSFFSKTWEYKGVKKIVEKTFNKWEIISVFDKEGVLLQETNSRKKIRSDYIYEYVLNDTLLEVKRINKIDNVNNLRIEHYYFDISGQCYKFSVSFSESGAHSYFGDNFVYENGMLVSYTEANNWQKNNGIPIKIIYKYNKEK